MRQSGSQIALNCASNQNVLRFVLRTGNFSNVQHKVGFNQMDTDTQHFSSSPVILLEGRQTDRQTDTYTHTHLCGSNTMLY